jgi:predicted YcjX-like family ATPase
MNKWVEKNEKEFGVQIQELQKIIESQVLATGNSDQFTSDMLVALKTGRKITPKMEAAIDKIIKVNSPDEMLKRQEWVDRVVPKLMMVSNLISDTSWNEDYKANTHRFMNSLIKQAKTRKTLSKKQMDSASSIYARVKKNIKKNEKKT